MALAPGVRLGPYAVTAQATDLKLAFGSDCPTPRKPLPHGGWKSGEVDL